MGVFGVKYLPDFSGKITSKYTCVFDELMTGLIMKYNNFAAAVIFVFQAPEIHWLNNTVQIQYSLLTKTLTN